MKNVIAYLTFNGNCKEAMHYYQECLGGELVFQTIGSSPMAVQLPKKMKNYILHATLTNETTTIMATDITPQNGINKGNAVSLLVDCSSEEEIKTIFNKLAVGGYANHPLEDTFWGAIFGGLTDKYGNHWLLNYTK
jgi:PhnB protein